ncbi:MAG: hypothetical protein P1V51_19870 [Deltaproteobacteria bacterium]|nr:hypothetical protein [Deltaproteobacteria bacterium]
MTTPQLYIKPPCKETKKLEGFRQFWMKYVRGANPRKHCQKGLVGPVSPKIKIETLPLATVIDLDEVPTAAWDYLYICGVHQRLQWSQNFHMPLRLKPGSVAVLRTWNGYEFRVKHAELLEIPALPEGWKGLAAEFTTCRNFQFAVARYGYPSLF